MIGPTPEYPATGAGRRRFYREVAVAGTAGNFRITLHGTVARTPAGAPLAVPRRPLATAISREWAAQGDTLHPRSMPLTALANTAIDAIPRRREATVRQVLSFAATDLLCYRAEAPADLVARQGARWQPLLDWLAEAHGAPLEVTRGVVPVTQPRQSLEALLAVLEEADDMAMAALAALAAACGSLTIALALWAGRIDAKEALELSLIDESFQAERWGEDAEAIRRRRRLGQDMAAAALFLSA